MRYYSIGKCMTLLCGKRNGNSLKKNYPQNSRHFHNYYPVVWVYKTQRNHFIDFSLVAYLLEEHVYLQNVELKNQRNFLDTYIHYFLYLRRISC